MESKSPICPEQRRILESNERMRLFHAGRAYSGIPFWRVLQMMATAYGQLPSGTDTEHQDGTDEERVILLEKESSAHDCLPTK